MVELVVLPSVIGFKTLNILLTLLNNILIIKPNVISVDILKE